METPRNPVPKHSPQTPAPRTLGMPDDDLPNDATVRNISVADAAQGNPPYMAWEPPIKEDESSWDSI